MGPESVKWRIRYNSELYSIYTDPDIIKTIKISKLRWTGHIMRMPEENPVKKLTLLIFHRRPSYYICVFVL